MARTEFRGQVVWITGASAGIGEALAVLFAREGASLVLSARREDELQRVAALCHEAARVEIVALDLADLDALPAVTARVLDLVGAVDVMVHNGGVSQRSLIVDTQLSVDERIMRVNHFGAVAITKALLPSMVARRRGRFVVVSSVMGVYSSPQRSAYAASKHALHGFFDALRAEHVGDNIGVTMVCPGFVRTNVSANALTGDGSPRGVTNSATARGMSVERCAADIVEAIRRGREEVYLGRLEVVGVYAKRFVPRLLSWLITRVKVT